jgi:hypothetical protein
MRILLLSIVLPIAGLRRSNFVGSAAMPDACVQSGHLFVGARLSRGAA